MDKAVETLPEKDLFRWTCVFYNLQFYISTSSPLFNVVTTWQCPRSVFQHWKGGEGVCLSTKQMFLKLRKDADRERLFCSDVSTLLSMIVGSISAAHCPTYSSQFGEERGLLTWTAAGNQAYLVPRVLSYPPSRKYNLVPRAFSTFRNGGTGEYPGQCWTNTLANWSIHTNRLIGLNTF